jgi:FtsZ-interacting cell division protein YlmF
MQKKLWLYVWNEVLVDYTSGVMFALAGSAEEARELIRAQYPDSASVRRDLAEAPEEYAEPVGFAVWGGG